MALIDFVHKPLFLIRIQGKNEINLPFKIEDLSFSFQYDEKFSENCLHLLFSHLIFEQNQMYLPNLSGAWPGYM